MKRICKKTNKGSNTTNCGADRTFLSYLLDLKEKVAKEMIIKGDFHNSTYELLLAVIVIYIETELLTLK